MVYLKRISKVVFLAVLLIGGAGAIRAQNTDPQGYVEGLVSDLVSSPGQKVDVFGISIGLTGNVTAERATVSDVDGTWMEVKDLSLDWQPLSLLRDTLIINSLDVGSVEFLRAARTPPTESQTEVPAPRPVTVNRFEFRSIVLAEELVGERVEMTAGGTIGITAGPVRIAVETNLERTDGGAGSFRAKIEYQPESQQLAVDIAGTDGPDGLVGNLLNVPGRPKIDLTISGAGAIDAWDGNISLKAGTDEALAGEIRIAGVEEGRRAGMSLTGSLSPYMPVVLQPAFSNRSALAGSVLFPNTDGPVVLETLVIETAAVNVSASGSMGTDGSDMSLNLSARTPENETVLARFSGDDTTLSASALALDLTLSGRPANPQWTLGAQASRIALGPDTATGLRVTGASEPAGESVSGFAINLSGTVESTRNADWAASLRGPIEAAVTGSYGADQPLTIRSARMTVAAGSIGIDGILQPTEDAFDVEIAARLHSLRTGIEMVDRLLGDPTTLTGRVARNGANAPLNLSDLTLSSPALSARLNGTYSERDLNLSAEGRLSDLARLSENAGGSVSFRATLGGGTERPDLSLRANGDGITLSGKPFENAAIAFDGILDPSAPSGEFLLSGRYAGSPVTAAFTLGHDPDGTRILRDLQASISGARLSGELRLPPDNRLAGRLAFDAPDLEPLGDFLLVELDGTMTGSIELIPDGPSSRAVIEASGSDIRAAGLIAASVNADVTIGDISKPVEIVGDIRARQVSRGKYAVDSLNVTARPEGGAYAIELQAKGKSLDGTAAARLDPQPDGLIVDLRNADIKVAGVAMKLERAGRIVIAGNETRIDPIRLALAEGTLEVEGRYGATVDLKIRAGAVPLSLADPLVPDLGLRGTLTGGATASGNPEAPTVDFDASVTALSTNAIRETGLPPFNLTATGNVRNNVVTLDGRATGAAGTAITATGQVDLNDNARLDLTVRGNVPIAVIADQLARNGIRASGTAVPDIRITGTAASPDIRGAVSLTQATLGDADGRFVVRGVSAQLRFEGDRITLANFSGNTVGGGTVTASGSGGLAAESPLNVTAQIRRGRYVDDTLVVATFDADLTIGGSRAGGIVIDGDITLLETTITLDSLPPAAREIADVIHKHPPIPVARQWALLQERGGRSSGTGTAIDISMRTAKPILVIGRGINADFGGNLQITGTTGDIRASGRFTLIRGFVSLVGRRLDFDRGTLLFSGDLNPEIDISATGTSPEASVTLLITGDVEKPEIRITSVPELPPEEAMASLVFQQSATELSPIQLARLADALLVLSGGARSGLFEGLRRAAGIDRLDIRTDSSGQTSVGVGSYLNDRTYLGVQQGIETGDTTVTIDLDVTRTLKLRAGAGTNGETEAGILFEKEY